MYAIQVLVDQGYLYVLDLFEIDEDGNHKPTLYSTKEEAEREAAKAGWAAYNIVEYVNGTTS